MTVLVLQTVGAGHLSQQQQQMLPAEQLSVVAGFEPSAAIRRLRRSGAAVAVGQHEQLSQWGQHVGLDRSISQQLEHPKGANLGPCG